MTTKADQGTAADLAKRISTASGDVTLKLTDGSTLTGPAKVLSTPSNATPPKRWYDEQSFTPTAVTITAASAEWTVSLGCIVAVGEVVKP